MIIAVPKETAAFEQRVSITPDMARKLIDLGYSVHVQKSAGSDAGFSDEMYETAGCKLTTEKGVYKDATLVCRVAPPSDEEIDALPKNSYLIGMLKPHQFKDHLGVINKKKITSFSMELLPRITRGQAMDVLSSQSNLAGYKAVVDAASVYSRGFPLMMTAAGTVPAAKVFVLGVGVAGLQAIATAKRLGAIVSAYDAKEMSEGYKEAEQAKLLEVMKTQDIVITTAQIPGKPAPKLVSEDMLKVMREGSVVVDLAVETGGNCAHSKLGKVITKHGVTIMGYANMPSRVAYDASQLYARNLFNFIKTLFVKKEDVIEIDFDDELIKGTNLTRDGNTVHPQFGGGESQ
jgi:H+-translocating NAD(P) transhydrogenase subunit alpha